MARRGEVGATLLEILISLGLITVGMLGLFATLSSVTFGSSTASRLEQAQLRGQSILESIRMAPTTTLNCLVGAGSGWAGCEAGCVAAEPPDAGGVGAASVQACILTTTSMSNLGAPPPPGSTATASNQSSDRAGLPYLLVFDGTGGARDTFVRRSGPGSRVYDVQVTVGWNDSGTTTVTPGTAGVHMLTLRTGVFR